jgi:hypothetical protein
MNIDQSDLLSGESVILSKGANAVIKISDYGLSRIAFDQLMWTVGMKGKEAIGGKLHLTNYRLIFKSHPLNRLRGKFSIFLPTIREVKDVSGLISKKIEVFTQTQAFEFVVWGIPALIAAIKSSKSKLDPKEVETMRTAAVKNYEKCGEGLKIFKAVEAINVGVLTAQQLLKIVELTQNPIEVSGIMNLLEMFSEE